MAVTIKQVAARSGLSVPTVSHVLSGRGDTYREATRRRVMQAAQDLGYRPNGFARAIRSGRFNAVALLLSTTSHRSSVFVDMLDGIQDALIAQEMRLTLAKLPDEKLTRRGHVPRVLREWSCDGLLINYNTAIPQALIEQIADYGVASIWINSKQQADCVYPNDFDAGRRATRRLLELGHRRIAWVCYAPHSPDNLGPAHYSVADRRAGYLDAMHHAGLTPQCIDQVVPPAQRAAYSQGWLEQPDRPTAIVTYSAEMAWPALYVATAHLGLKVPRDLSAITFEESLATEMGLAVDTLLIPEYAVGHTATQMLLEKIKAPDYRLPPQPLPFGFEPGASCAPPPGG